MLNVLNNPDSVSLLLAALLQRLQRIEERLEKKVSFLPMSEAINAYKDHLHTGTSCRGRSFSLRSAQNFQWLLNKLEEYFPDRNVSEITAEECGRFLHRYWDRDKTGSFKQRQLQLKIFFSFCILYLKRKGNPIFHNPCELLDPIAHIPEQPEWIPTEIVRRFIETAKKEHHWLAFSMLLTSGMRINDLMNLRKKDIRDGRIMRLTAHDNYRPKSGKPVEIAIIPQTVADRLMVFLEGKAPYDNIMPVTEIALSKAITSHGRQVGIKLNPHMLRKWCSSFWDRKNDKAMVQFVLRHSAIKLQDRYIAPLAIEEVIEKQILLEKELF